MNKEGKNNQKKRMEGRNGFDELVKLRIIIGIMCTVIALIPKLRLSIILGIYFLFSACSRYFSTDLEIRHNELNNYNIAKEKAKTKISTFLDSKKQKK